MKRLVAQELTWSFVPEAEQRLWRTVMRRKYQITRNRVQLHNRLESLLEEAHIKLSSLVSDLLGTSARRMLQNAFDHVLLPALLVDLTPTHKISAGLAAPRRAAWRMNFWSTRAPAGYVPRRASGSADNDQ